MQKVEDALRTALAFWSAIKERNSEKMMSQLSETLQFDDCGPDFPEGVFSRNEFLEKWDRTVLNICADMNTEIEEAAGFGDRCILRWKAASGLRAVLIFRVRDSRIWQILCYQKHACEAK